MGDVMGTAHLYIDDSAIESGRRSARLTFADGSEVTLWYEVDGIGADRRIRAPIRLCWVAGCC